MRDRLIAMEALALAGAASLAERDVTTLSGGEMARVQFARVLAQLRPQDVDSGAQPKPRYLLLGEPTDALDLAHQHHLLRTLRELAKEWHIGVLAIHARSQFGCTLHRPVGLACRQHAAGTGHAGIDHDVAYRQGLSRHRRRGHPANR